MGLTEVAGLVPVGRGKVGSKDARLYGQQAFE